LSTMVRKCGRWWSRRKRRSPRRTCARNETAGDVPPSEWTGALCRSPSGRQPLQGFDFFR
jgi:hypothetical protein